MTLTIIVQKHILKLNQQGLRIVGKKYYCRNNDHQQTFTKPVKCLKTEVFIKSNR